MSAATAKVMLLVFYSENGIDDLLDDIVKDKELIANRLKVNNEKLASPFTIKAIGLPESLAGVEMPGSYIDILRENGIVVDVKKSNNIEINNFDSSLNYESRRILNYNNLFCAPTPTFFSGQILFFYFRYFVHIVMKYAPGVL